MGGGERARGLNFADSSEKYMESWLCARASVCAATYHKLAAAPGPGPGGSGRRGTGGHMRYSDATFTSRKYRCRRGKSVSAQTFSVCRRQPMRFVGGDSVITLKLGFLFCYHCCGKALLLTVFSVAPAPLLSVDVGQTAGTAYKRAQHFPCGGPGRGLSGGCAVCPHGSSHVCPHILA